MNKYQAKKVNIFLPDILINGESKDKLFSFATSHNLTELEYFITTDSISLHVKNNNNQTIMHVLLAGESTTNEEELLRCIKFLVERGAPISSIDKFNLTPLFICIKKNYPLIFTYLLEKGASLDINTYDNLTVLHVLSQPDYSIHNSNGIQNLIPEKLPKIKMEKYTDVYKQIDEIFQSNFNDDKDGLKTDVEKFKTIASQFYYHDDREDFNNTLLKEEYKDILYDEKKTNIFEKLRNKLDDFYTSDTVDTITEYKLNTKLNTISKKLNEMLEQAKMRDYNNNVLQAIESLAHSLELSIHLDNPIDVQIATNVVIAIANGAGAGAGAIENALLNIDTVRVAIQLVEAVYAVPGVNQQIIDIIKTAAVQAAALPGIGATPAAVQAAVQAAAAGIGAALPATTDPAVVLAVQAATATVPAAPLAIPVGVALIQGGRTQQFVARVASEANIFVNNVRNIRQSTVNALQTTDAVATTVPIVATDQVKVIAVMHTAIRASVYAAVYIQNTVSRVKNITAVHTAVQAAVQDARLPVGVNLTGVQAALTDQEVAIEAVLAAACGLVITINNTAVDADVVVTVVKEALKNIDDLEKTHIATNVVIAIAEAAREIATADGAAPADVVTAITEALWNIDAIRAVVQSVVFASTLQGTNKAIIDLIQREAVSAVAIAGIYGTGARGVYIVYTALGQAAVITGVKRNNPQVDANAFVTAVQRAIVQPAQFTIAVDTAFGNAGLQQSIERAITQATSIVNNVRNIKTTTENALQSVAVVPILTEADKAKVIAVVCTVTRAAAYAAVYRQNTVNPVANITSVHVAVQAEVQAAVQAVILPAGVNKAAVQAALTDQKVAVETVIASASFAASAVNAVVGATGQVMITTVKEALTLPKIIPNFLKNSDYNKLRILYKLINIPPNYLNYNTSYWYNNNKNIKSLVLPNNYKLPEGNRSYSIDYFNLLHTFNEYAKNNYNQLPDINDDIFILYQYIQQIYKYNYITYIFDIEKKKILKLNDNIKNVENKNLFDKNFKELEKSVESIREQLKKIEDLANEYIDIYNKRNGYKIFANPNTPSIYIGIYPKIKFPKLTNNQTEMYIKYTFGEENAIIAECNNYITYNNNKNDFFHNFVLYFQDIGIINGVADVNLLLNGIQEPINYNININANHNLDINEIYKAYKLYFYDPIYLKLEKQNIIKKILVDDDISAIIIPNFDDFFNNYLSKEFNIKLKTKILNEILENKFNTILKNEIDIFLNKTFSINDGEIEYDITIKDPDFDAILLNSLGFSNILIPNYEFTNNKFLSISRNRFLKCILYFDINYFKSSNISTLKYYKENKFITEILKNHKPLLFKTDIKGWTPIYYAIDGNNYKVIEKILEANINTLIHYDHKETSPLKLCINKQLNHLNYLLTEKDEIHYLNNYINMLRNELESNKLSIPLNIEAVFVIALFIQNHLWSEDADTVNLYDITNLQNTRKTQINKEYNYINTKRFDVDNNDFKYNDQVYNVIVQPKRTYTLNPNNHYNYNDDDTNIITTKYYDIAKQLEKQDFGLYGSYWKKYENNNKILDHINKSIELKTILKNLGQIESKTNKFNLPFYDISKINTLDIKNIKTKLEHYLKFINIRFNTNKDNAYVVFLDKIYVHVLANIIGVDFYLTMEELIVKYYINKGDVINNNNNVDKIKDKLKILNKYLINNKLDKTNINYLYISAKNPESVLKEKIKEVLKNNFISVDDGEELISMYETVVLPRYRDLYKITYKYLQMFISNYHKFIYNQYHGLEILLLLLEKLGKISS